MIADETNSTPAIGSPDAALLEADAFHHAIVSFIEQELQEWRDRPDRPLIDDEPRLNETLCDHLDCAARHSFDTIRFCHEPYQTSGRNADVAVKPAKHIMVEGLGYSIFEQLLPIECKRLPTPKGPRRSDCEYVHGLPGSRVGAIERFKHGLHGPTNQRAMIIAYVQEQSFAHWLSAINARLTKLADDGADDGFWSPAELLKAEKVTCADLHKLRSLHRRLINEGAADEIKIAHLWLQMN